MDVLRGTTAPARLKGRGIGLLRLRGAHLVLRTSAAYLGLTPKQLQVQLGGRLRGP